MIRSLLSFRSLSILAALVVTFTCANQASAADGTTLIDLTPYIGIGLTVIGAAFGISRLAAAAYESMARQPEVAGTIQTAMIIAAALIEGFTFFALFLCTPK
ncbi:MAG: ATP synthase F0 subunit C [Planctomycetia bacterium]|nr:ATP synthase F0 subunit C [Planctomycetia bacterium]